MDGENELLYTFNKILLDKRDEIIEIASNKKRGEKKMNDINKLNKDISTTLTRIQTENEKKIKKSARYKKKEEI
jgi:hypothetical protein